MTPTASPSPTRYAATAADEKEIDWLIVCRRVWGVTGKLRLLPVFFYYLFISLLFFLQNTKAGTLILPSEESWKTGCCFFAGMFHVTLRTVCVSSALRITTQQGPGNGRVERRVPLQQVTTTRGQFSVVGLVSLFTLLIYWIVLRFVSP